MARNARADRAVDDRVGAQHREAEQGRHDRVIADEPPGPQPRPHPEVAEPGEADRATAELPAGGADHAETFRVGDDQDVERLGDRQGQQSHVDARKPQAGRPDDQAEQHRHHGPERHGGPDAETEIDAEHRGRVTTDAEDRHLAQREDARIAEQQVPLRRDGGQEQCQDDLTQDVTALDEERDRRDGGQHDGGRDEVSDRPRCRSGSDAGGRNHRERL